MIKRWVWGLMVDGAGKVADDKALVVVVGMALEAVGSRGQDQRH